MYLKYKLDQFFKEWSYVLFDHSSPILPIWGVVLILMVGLGFFYLVFQRLVNIILLIASSIILIAYITRQINNICYQIKYVRRSQKDEKKVVETRLSEPPLFRN